jgi:hypothetical protein
MTTVSVIRKWLEEAKREGATHMIVACDTFDWGNYPISVMPGDSALEKVRELRAKPMTKVMEVYSLRRDIEAQLGEERSFHYD